MLRKKIGIIGDPYLLDVTTGTEYRRTVCALAWPYADVHGCVIVIGELRHPPAMMDARRHVHVLGEARSASPDKLLEEAARMQVKWLFPTVVTPVGDPRITLVDQYNADRRRARLPVLRLVEPSAWRGKGEGLLSYYMAILQRRITDDKSLHFGPDCTARDEAQRAGKDDINRKMIEMPGVCALAWAVENMDVEAQPEWYERRHIIGGPADQHGGY